MNAQLRQWGPTLGAVLALVAITLVTGQWLHGSAAATGGDYSVIILALLYVNLFVVLGLAVLVWRTLAHLWRDRRQGLAGSRLRTRMALLMVALSVVPTLIIAGLSVELLNRGVDSWFSDRVTQALDHSIDLARNYYREAQRTVRHDAEAIMRARSVTNALSLQGIEGATEVLERERVARGLDAAAILRVDGTQLAEVGDFAYDPLPDLAPLAEGTTRALLVTSESGNRVRAFVRLDEKLFLMAGRWIDSHVFTQLEAIETAYVGYNQLRAARGLLKTSHTVTLLLIALLLLLSAIFFGVRVADRLTEPITRLVVGTQEVAGGNLSVVIPVSGDDELATLMAAFNAMTAKLAENRQELQSTNDLLEERRRFMEAIVGNISAGVISVNRENRVTLINAAAGRLLGVELERALNRHFGEVLARPVREKLLELWQEADARQSKGGRGSAGLEVITQSSQVQVEGPDKPLTLLARLTPLFDEQGRGQGFVATFDDLTEVLVAQRALAWSDVARRIAHEIKNPLTPIQLSAQRMRRKYLKECARQADSQVLDECTNTIIQQVEELRVLVNEFSTFARLPRPNLRRDDLNAAVHEVLVLHQADLAGMAVEVSLSRALRPFPFDRGQIKQVLTNLLANAKAAIEEQPNGGPGRIAITTQLADNGLMAAVGVADSGPGIPPADRNRVFEPYFTTKKKGTGLGLAIVKKIVEDHRGVIRLRESPWGGLLVECHLPLDDQGHESEEQEHPTLPL